MTFPVLSASTPSTGYKLTRSLRFRASATAYLSRTPASASSRTTWTWSAWVKLGAISTARSLFSAGADGSNYTSIDLRADQRVQVFSNTAGIIVGSIVWSPYVWRDPSAWYHFVIVCDTTNATQANRFRFYINNVQYTGISSTPGESDYPAQNANTNINNTVAHSLGRKQSNASEYFDGYMAEVNFINGQALTPSSFGSTNSTTGVWQPAQYTGTYGTNGFYLPFTDNSALTTSSNAGLGKDFSGNANYWVTNNISITAGATYDSMTDVPTLTSATAANFAVCNPLDVSNATIAGGNLNVTTTNIIAAARGTISVSSGKWYWEVTNGGGNPGAAMIGIARSDVAITSCSFSSANGWYYFAGNGQKYNNNTGTTYGATYTTSVIGVALDCDNGTLTFYKDNVSQGTAFTGLTGIPLTSNYDNGSGTSGSTGNHNFGQRPFSYTPPSGFVALNTYNLPASTVSNGAAYMAATLYTGTLLSNTIANTVGSASFQPDFVWIKSRSAATDNKLTDSVRGVTKGLISNTTAAETTDTQGLTAFGSTGFTVGTNTDYNNLSATYVAWQWNAGGSTVTNTNGSISSQVRANTTAGFSVVTYTGVTSTNVTVGHGLGVAPNMIIVKSRSLVTGWYTYHVSLPNTQFLALNTTQAATNGGDVWNSTTPTSSVFYLSTNGNVNQNATFVAYCFAAIKGFSAFGSYTGNGVADGPFTYTGFRPRWVMIKRSDTANDGWYIVDSSRSPYNQTINALRANASDAESSESVGDFLSNGFKIRIGANGNFNASGGTYIYAAFAESPFQNSLAR
jgi:hypothetical protein